MKEHYKLVNNLTAIALLTAAIMVVLSFVSCTDSCENTETYVYLEPVYTSAEVVRASFASRDPQSLEEPGKIYRKDHFLFINERGKGLHIFDNNDKENPVPLSFLNIPGNFDISVKGDIMYADSFVDLLVLDISDPKQVKLVRRINNVLNNLEIMGFYSSEETGFITDFTEIETITVSDCDESPAFPNRGGGLWLESSQFAALDGAARSGNGSPGNGLGGSFARFTIHTDFLYVVDSWSMHVFDIDILQEPKEVNLIELGWGIETIFPYRDKLFIGSNTGMQIFDNADPENPTFVSSFDHALACDPVVVDKDHAFITLRAGNRCFGIDNQLDVVNITAVENPWLVKSYPMDHPHGLAIDRDILFLCEGKYGLKVFDVKDKKLIDQNLLTHLPEVPAYDVIAIDSHLILVGDNGIYQFDYSNPAELKQLSVIPVK